MTKAKKCLFIAGLFPPYKVGGSLVYNYYLLSKCTAEDVIVITRDADQSAQFDAILPYKILRKRYVPHPVETPPLGKLAWMIMLLPMLLFWILRYRVSVVHLGNIFPELIHGWVAARLTGCSVMATVYAEEMTLKDMRRWSVFKALRQLWERVAHWILRRCDAVLTASNFGKQVLLQFGVPEERIAVITPGIDMKKSGRGKPIDNVLALQRSGKRVLLTVGRFAPRKGQDMVLRALPQVLLKRPDVVYIMAGGKCFKVDDFCAPIIEELGLHDHAMTIEDPDDESIAWLYETCEVFIMANRTQVSGDTETYGIVFLEAGAWGKPVIGGRAGGVVEAVDDGVTGILVDGTNVDEIAGAIIKLLSDTALAKRMGEAGRQKVLQNNWDKKSNLYRELIDRLAAKNRANPRAGPSF